MTVPSPDIRVYVVGIARAEDEFAGYLENRVAAEDSSLELRDDLGSSADRQDAALDRIERALDVMALQASAMAARIEQRNRAAEIRRQQRLRRPSIRGANVRLGRGLRRGGLRNFALGR